MYAKLLNINISATEQRHGTELSGDHSGEHSGEHSGDHSGEHSGEHSDEHSGEHSGEHDLLWNLDNLPYTVSFHKFSHYLQFCYHLKTIMFCCIFTNITLVSYIYIIYFIFISEFFHVF
jgi:hypothetical protein